jgi:hypothetical protein
MRSLPLWLACLAFTTACGSTVQQAGNGSVLLPGDGLALPAANDAAGGLTVGAPGAGAEVGSTSRGTATGPGSAGAPAPAAVGSDVPGRRPAPGPVGSAAVTTGPGVSARQIKVGVLHVPGADAAFSSLGFELALGDTRAIYAAMIDHVNRLGGIAGRKLVPVYYAYDTSGNPEAQHAAACAALTEDEKVLFASGVTLGFGPSGDTLVPCLAKAGTSWITGKWSGDATFWSQYRRHLYSPDSVNSTREAAALVEAAAAQGFFTAGAKIGLIQIDRPELTRAVRDGLEPALARAGQKITERVTVTGDNGLPAAVASSVLRFKAMGITHMLFASPGGGVPTYFMTAAQNQDYEPRYALSSWDAPSVVQQLAPREQLDDTVGMGYLPVLDVDQARDPGYNASARACLKIYVDRGFDTSNRLAVGQMLGACDTLLLAKRALDRSPDLTAAGMERNVDRLGSSLLPAGTFANRYAPGPHDAAGAYRFLRFDDGCSCFTYVGANRSLR